MFKKYLKRTLLFLAIVFLIIGLSLTIIGFFYGDKAKQYIVSELSKQLNIEVSVRQIDFSVFRDFPEASIEFTGIQSRERSGISGDPLLTAGKLTLLFDIIDILWGNYTIEKIILKDASLNLVVYNDSLNNFNIFNKDRDTDESKLLISLQKLILSNVNVSYQFHPSDQEYIFNVKEGRLKGDFFTDKYLLQADAEIFTTYIRSGKLFFLRDTELKTALKITVDQRNARYTLKDATFLTSGLKLNIDGDIQSDGSNKNLNLKVETEKSSIPVLMRLIPDEYKQSIKNYPLDGKIILNANIIGEFSGDKLPHIACDFTVENGKFKYTPTGLTLKDISFKGIFENGLSRSKSTYSLRLSAFTAGVNAGQIEGELSIINFLKPQITVSLLSSLNLNKIDEIIRIEELQSISGNMSFELHFSNNLKSLHQFTLQDFISSRASGSLKLNGVNIRLKDDPVNYNDFTGSFKFNNKDLLIENFNGKINESDFNMKGYFVNLTAYTFLPDENIKIKADFSSSNLNMDDLLSLRKDRKGTTYRMRFSERINFDLNLNLKEFTFGTFKAQNIKGNAVMKNNKLTVNDATLKTMEGTASLSGSVDGNHPGKFWVMFTTSLQDVNIRQLFFQLGEFGQQNITSNHLQGKIDATIYYKSFIDPALKIEPSSVYALGDIIIREGELIKYTPLYKLSKYIKNKELEHIRFSTIKNQIEIKEQVIYIPEMDIESSTLNLKISGNHTFTNMIDYHVRILLSELLSKRDKKKEEDIDGIFPAEDGLGKTTLFLRMTGNAEDPDIRYDTKEVRKKIADDLNKEKQEIKDIFKKEFNRDDFEERNQDVFNQTLPEKGKNFKIEWDEDQPEQSKKTETLVKPKIPSDKKTTKKDFIIEWDEDKDTLNRFTY